MFFFRSPHSITFAQHRRAQVLIVAQPGYPKATMQRKAKQLEHVGTRLTCRKSATTAQVRLAYHTWSSGCSLIERAAKVILFNIHRAYVVAMDDGWPRCNCH